MFVKQIIEVIMSQGSVSCSVCSKPLEYGKDIIGEASWELRDTDSDTILGARNTFYCTDHYKEKISLV